MNVKFVGAHLFVDEVDTGFRYEKEAAACWRIFRDDEKLAFGGITREEAERACFRAYLAA